MRAKVRAQIQPGPSQPTAVKIKTDQLWFIFTLSRMRETGGSWFVCVPLIRDVNLRGICRKVLPRTGQ